MKQLSMHNFVIIASVGLIPLMVLFLYYIYRQKGHLDKSDWIIAICVALGAAVFLLATTYHYIKHYQKGD